MIRTRLASISFLLLVLGGGCVHQQTRLQSDDTDHVKDADVKTVGDVTSVSNANPIHVTGIGIVVGLEGTGGPAPTGSYRSTLERDLQKRRCEHVKEMLNSPNTSLVLVSAVIAAGAHKDDPLDVEVVLPPQSKTTSLKGGVLLECDLFNYDTTKHLDPNSQGPNRGLIGHPLAKASGPLLVGYGNGDESAKLRQGRIWGGGRSRVDRPFYLVINEEFKQVAKAEVAQRVANRINDTVQGPYHGGSGELALAKTSQVVFLSVPPQYHHNLPRYLRVIRLIPLREPSAGYRRHLCEELLDPKKTVTAALRLEAMGAKSVDVLKEGLQSEHALVKFASAEALAYLGSPACGEELARLVQEQPALRAFSLTAMASLDENVCRVKLGELLSSPSAEVRYGAFRALRALDDREALVRGDLLNESFWLHRVAPQSPGLVHLSHSRRAEIVLFGEEAELRPPFSFLAGDFTITADSGDTKATISRISSRRGVSRKQCPLQLVEFLHALADMGATYPNVDELLTQAHRCECLSCPLAIDALPQATSVYQLAKTGADNVDFQKSDQEILDARSQFGSTPTLFEKAPTRKGRPVPTTDATDRLLDSKPKNEKRNAGK